MDRGHAANAEHARVALTASILTGSGPHNGVYNTVPANDSAEHNRHWLDVPATNRTQAVTERSRGPRKNYVQPDGRVVPFGVTGIKQLSSVTMHHRSSARQQRTTGPPLHRRWWTSSSGRRVASRASDRELLRAHSRSTPARRQKNPVTDHADAARARLNEPTCGQPANKRSAGQHAAATKLESAPHRVRGVAAVDEGQKKIMWLAEQGRFDDPVIVFTNDNACVGDIASRRSKCV